MFNFFKKKNATEEVVEATSRYEGDLFKYALDYASAPDRNYLANIQRNIIPKDKFFEIMKAHLKTVTNDEKQIEETCSQLDKRIWGYYILEDLLADDDISDIKIYDENHIRVKRKNERKSTSLKFIDKADYISFVDNICSKNKVSLTDVNAIRVFTDVDNNKYARLRFNITGDILNENHRAIIHIRKILKRKKTLDTLIKQKMFPPELRPYLETKAKCSSGIVFTGKGASGKTTLMNAMLEEIPTIYSGLVIQESAELFSSHPDFTYESPIIATGEGKVKHDLQELARNGLLTDNDYYIIGEIKGDEAKSFAIAEYTGHKCWTSSHGKSSQDAMYKFADYIMQATGYSQNEVLKMLAAMEVVIFMKNYKVQEISEIVGLDTSTDNYKLKYRKVYDRKCPEKSSALNYKPNQDESEELEHIKLMLESEHELDGVNYGHLEEKDFGEIDLGNEITEDEEDDR